jgi:oxygen-independent coproporphyrinogen-3 oxidase
VSAIQAELPATQFARLALGGGTPTFLTTPELEQLFKIISQLTGSESQVVPFSSEASPATVGAEKLAFLRSRGVDRLSLGVQSFDDRESHAMGRPQKREQVDKAIELVRDSNFPILNLDLIYGGEGQALDSWMESLEVALTHRPEELYLYPLYVRDLTGLGKVGRQSNLPEAEQIEWDQWRLSAYRSARELLLERGYEQVSFRMFRLPSNTENGPVYCCQQDGMLGLGCGARSYTEDLHYSLEYSVSSNATLSIIEDFTSRSVAEFSHADYGIELPEEDRRRRYLIMSLLQVDGMRRRDYIARFGSDAITDFQELLDLEIYEFAIITDDRIQLTAAGLERSDAIGPWLCSKRVQQRMESYECR